MHICPGSLLRHKLVQLEPSACSCAWSCRGVLRYILLEEAVSSSCSVRGERHSAEWKDLQSHHCFTWKVWIRDIPPNREADIYGNGRAYLRQPPLSCLAFALQGPGVDLDHASGCVRSMRPKHSRRNAGERTTQAMEFIASELTFWL
jgi:hypothetical protein